MRIPQYYVTADPDTGKWLTVPQFNEKLVDQARWVEQANTYKTHYDIYNVDIRLQPGWITPLCPNNNELLTETRAIEIRFYTRYSKNGLAGYLEEFVS
jgi:hypothetical protein